MNFICDWDLCGYLCTVLALCTWRNSHKPRHRFQEVRLQMAEFRSSYTFDGFKFPLEKHLTFALNESSWASQDDTTRGWGPQTLHWYCTSSDIYGFAMETLLVTFESWHVGHLIWAFPSRFGEFTFHCAVHLATILHLIDCAVTSLHLSDAFNSPQMQHVLQQQQVTENITGKVGEYQ